MSQHSSLKGAEAGARHRNVLKRFERVRALQEAEKWGDRKSVYKLPKMKLLKIKVKKVKAKAEEQPATTEATPAPAKAPAQKPQK